MRRAVETVALDVASEKSMQSALEKTGSFDHIILTTRPAITPKPLADTDISEAKQAFETKFWGPCRFLQMASNAIRPNGSIVMTSGIAGEKIYANQSVMSVINSATETLCRVLAVELAPIRGNVVSPGLIAPKSAEAENYARQFPVGRIAAPDEVADAYFF